jgi:carboxyl-terminal processing protease
MTLPELLLAVYATAGGLILAVWRRPGRFMWRLIAILGGVFLIAVIVEGSHRLEVIPMMIVAVVVAALTFRRSRWQSPPLPRRRRILAAGLRYVAALLVALVVLLDAAFIEIFDPLSDAPIAEIFIIGPRNLDFSHDRWTDAFEKLNDHLSRAYALGAWKRIDWKTLHDLTAPEIANAERTGDRSAYYRALREYLWSLNDGHVHLSGSDGGLRNVAIRGGYGLFLVRLDDSRTIAHVLNEGPAASQGMQWGATILEWNGIPVDDAAARTSVLWYWAPPATNEGRRLAQLRLLTRAPVGTSATVVFQNPDEAAKRTATLVSVDDKFQTWQLAGPPQSFNLTDTNIDWRMLPESIGYVKIRAEAPTLPQLLPDRVMQRAVAEFVRASAKGVVIDVRRNPGGADKLVPRMMGFFINARQFFEYLTYYSETTSQFERQDALTLWTEPRAPHFAGPIAVLVDEWCASSCEGIALIARKRADGHVVGFHGTYGSFGMSGAEVRMPGGLTVEYPGGQSLDENGVVQLDSDWSFEGGVTPDIRVPLTVDTVRAQFNDGRDVVLETAIRTLSAPAR